MGNRWVDTTYLWFCFIGLWIPEVLKWLCFCLGKSMLLNQMLLSKLRLKNICWWGGIMLYEIIDVVFIWMWWSEMGSDGWNMEWLCYFCSLMWNANEPEILWWSRADLDWWEFEMILMCCIGCGSNDPTSCWPDGSIEIGHGGYGSTWGCP